jgi:hypothetical protein
VLAENARLSFWNADPTLKGTHPQARPSLNHLLCRSGPQAWFSFWSRFSCWSQAPIHPPQVDPSTVPRHSCNGTTGLHCSQRLCLGPIQATSCQATLPSFRFPLHFTLIRQLLHFLYHQQSGGCRRGAHPHQGPHQRFHRGQALVTARCNVKWRVEDDNGRVHTLHAASPQLSLLQGSTLLTALAAALGQASKWPPTKMRGNMVWNSQRQS